MRRSNVVSLLQAPATRSKFVPVRWGAANAPMDGNLSTTIAAGGRREFGDKSLHSPFLVPLP